MKIQSRTIKKRYKKGKREYRYKQHLLPFPTKQNEKLKPFLQRELQFKMNVKDDVLNVILTKEKENLTKHSEKRLNYLPNLKRVRYNEVLHGTS